MYVCVCHQLTDHDLQERYGAAETAEELFELLGEYPICGKCIDYIRTELQERRRPDQARRVVGQSRA